MTFRFTIPSELLPVKVLPPAVAGVVAHRPTSGTVAEGPVSGKAEG